LTSTRAPNGGRLLQPAAVSDRELLQRYHVAGDPAAREVLITRYLPLARRLARRYRHASEPIEDLEQVASVALIRAADAFDPARATAFSSYAVPCIVGSIKRHFRDLGWSVRVPRDLQELALQVQRINDNLTGELGRPPTVREIAARAELSVEAVVEAREAYGALRADSLDQPSRDGEDDGASRLDALAADGCELDRLLDRSEVESLLGVLDERQSRIVRLYFHSGLTQSEIGRHLGYSQMHVSRLLRGAITTLTDAASSARAHREPIPLAQPAGTEPTDARAAA
jgi:RNA polymerase sigma-B factor